MSTSYAVPRHARSAGPQRNYTPRRQPRDPESVPCARERPCISETADNNKPNHLKDWQAADCRSTYVSDVVLSLASACNHTSATPKTDDNTAVAPKHRRGPVALRAHPASSASHSPNRHANKNRPGISAASSVSSKDGIDAPRAELYHGQCSPPELHQQQQCEQWSLEGGQVASPAGSTLKASPLGEHSAPTSGTGSPSPQSALELERLSKAQTTFPHPFQPAAPLVLPQMTADLVHTRRCALSHGHAGRGNRCRVGGSFPAMAAEERARSYQGGTESSLPDSYVLFPQPRRQESFRQPKTAAIGSMPCELHDKEVLGALSATRPAECRFSVRFHAIRSPGHGTGVSSQQQAHLDLELAKTSYLVDRERPCTWGCARFEWDQVRSAEMLGHTYLVLTGCLKEQI
jgi:hypothetical protein